MKLNLNQKLSFKSGIFVECEKGRVQVGTGSAACLLDDPTGCWATFVKLLDGQRTVLDLYAEVRALHPRLFEDDMLDVLQRFHANDFLQA